MQRIEGIVEALKNRDEKALAEALDGLSIKFDGDLGSLSDIADKLNLRLVENQSTSPLTQEVKGIPTIEVVKAFLEAKKASVSEASLVSYHNTLNVFARYCPVLPTTPEEIDTYLARFKEKRTAAGAFTVLRLLYKFANQRHHIPNVTEHVQRPKFKTKEPAWLTLEQAKRVLQGCRDDRELALIHLYLGHGLRLDEACRIDVGDIEDNQLSVRGKERTEYIPLLPETRELLFKLANGRTGKQPLFTGQHSKRLSHKMTYNVVKAILNRAGVLKEKGSQRIATHTLRKTFATLAYHAGRDRSMVERLLRHRKRDVSDLYIGMPMDLLRNYLEHYSPIRLLNHKSQPQSELHKIFSCSKLPPFGYPIVGKAIGFA